MVFMSRGVDVLELLVTNQIRSRDHVVEMVKRIADLFRNNLVNGCVRYLREVDPEAPDSAMIVDCTVCRIMRPKQPFRDAKVFFSGKHYISALKKEVCVNVKSGTAALISKAFPGSVHDLTILRDNADVVNEVLGGRRLLADLGYRGAQRDVPIIVVCEQNQRELRAKRVLVECFFGRLKMLLAVFSSTWRLGEECFDVFFDIGCALTNLDVLRRPLRESDKAYNEGVLNLLLIELQLKEQWQRRANEEYRQLRRARLEQFFDLEKLIELCHVVSKALFVFKPKELFFNEFVIGSCESFN